MKICFDHEKLHAYREALAFIGCITPILEIMIMSKIKRGTAPIRAIRVLLLLLFLLSFFTFGPGFATHAASQSIARVWNEEILAGIRIDIPHPPVHARNLFSFSVAVYDAWAAYDKVAVGYVYRGKHTATDLGAARREAISFAAYRILKQRYALSINSRTTLAALDARMVALRYDTNNISRDTSTPAGVGNSVYDAVSAWFINDGALQGRAYNDLPPNEGGYAPTNSLLNVTNTVTSVVDVNRWQPLQIANAVSQNGLPLPSRQKFVGSQWLLVRPFALARHDSQKPWIDPGPPPYLGGIGDAEFRSNIVDVIRRSSELTPDDGVMMDISPGAFGNNSLGANDGAGHAVNPSTGLPYAPNLVKRGDFARALADFWADGPDSDTPPGHWNVVANSVSDSPRFVKRIAGTGPVVDDLEWDVKVYFALNAAVHEAACAAWSLKRVYDGWRPITCIRYMGKLGQSSNPNGPSYHTNGLPLITNLIERVTAATAAPGGRHAGLTPDSIAIYTWPGEPNDRTNQYSGVRWIEAVAWLPYQAKGFVTPAFPGYISGHSTFSRAAAELLAAITGSPFFPGGLGTHTINKLTVEKGPSQPVQLQWATYFDASDQAGLSRIWGGIHPPVDDFPGRRVGAQCGRGVWALAQKYFDGSVTRSPVALSIRLLNPAECEVRYDTLRGLFYKLQSTPDLRQSFTDDPVGSTQGAALDSSYGRIDGIGGPRKFYRVISDLRP